VVNVERIPGGPVTIELTNLPESKALDIILRSLAGFVAAPRPQTDPDASRFDRIVVMPQLAAVAPVAASGNPRVAAPQPSMGLQPAGGRTPFSPRLMPGFPGGGESAEVNDGGSESDGPPDVDPDEAAQAVLERAQNVRPGQISGAVGTAATPGMVIPLPADTRRPPAGGIPAVPGQPPRPVLPPKPPGQP
jgi:hypothetical protein